MRQAGYRLGETYRHNPWALAHELGILVRRDARIPNHVTITSAEINGRYVLMVSDELSDQCVKLLAAALCGMLVFCPDQFERGIAWVRFQRHPLGQVFARAFLGVDDMRLAG